MNRWLLGLLVVAALQGGFYAMFTPAWSMVDEPQHIDYVAHIATFGKLPIPGQTKLAPEIINSIFATEQWPVWFQLPTPKNSAEMGVAAWSYEAYHPPLFYTLLTPLFSALPLSILGKLYVLRLACVAISLITVYCCWQSSHILSPTQSDAWHTLLLLVLVLHSERAAYTSRVNNDVLLEALGAACLWQTLRVWRKPHPLGQYACLGGLFAALCATKLSGITLLLALPLLLRWAAKSHKPWQATIVLIVPVVAVLTWVISRNLQTTGDWLGYRSFLALTAPTEQKPDFAWTALQLWLSQAWRNFWAIWWRSFIDTEGSWLGKTWLVWLSCCTAYTLWQLKNRSWNCAIGILAALFFAQTAQIAYSTLFLHPVIPQARFWAAIITSLILILGYLGHRPTTLLLWNISLLLLEVYWWYWSWFQNWGQPLVTKIVLIQFSNLFYSLNGFFWGNIGFISICGSLLIVLKLCTTLISWVNLQKSAKNTVDVSKSML